MDFHSDIALGQSYNLRNIRLPDIFQFQRNNDTVYLWKFGYRLIQYADLRFDIYNLLLG